MASKNRPGIEFLVKSIAGIALTILLLFLPAGTLDWRAGWAYVIVYVLVILATAYGYSSPFINLEYLPSLQPDKYYPQLIVATGANVYKECHFSKGDGLRPPGG